MKRKWCRSKPSDQIQMNDSSCQSRTIDLAIEKRITITPDNIKKYTDLKFSVLLENNYGEHLGINDQVYKKRGANLCSSAKEVFERSEIILKLVDPVNP